MQVTDKVKTDVYSYLANGPRDRIGTCYNQRTLLDCQGWRKPVIRKESYHPNRLLRHSKHGQHATTKNRKELT